LGRGYSLDAFRRHDDVPAETFPLKRHRPARRQKHRAGTMFHVKRRGPTLP
jgi:hypothetical protein